MFFFIFPCCWIHTILCFSAMSIAVCIISASACLIIYPSNRKTFNNSFINSFLFLLLDQIFSCVNVTLVCGSILIKGIFQVLFRLKRSAVFVKDAVKLILSASG